MGITKRGIEHMNRTTYTILQHTCKGTGITPTQALTIRKHTSLRATALYILHDYYKINQYILAKEFNMSQSGVSFCISKCVDRIFSDGEFRGKISKMVKKMAKFQSKKANNLKNNL
jgi:hypothetical protein